MSYASTGLSKFDYGRYLAACLTYFAHRQRDRVGIVTFDQDIVDHVPCSAKHLDTVLHTIDRAQAGRAGNLTTPLAKAAEHFGRRGILVLDLGSVRDARRRAGRGEAAQVPRAGSRGLPLLDPAEIDFGFDEASSFEDMESGEQLPGRAGGAGREYRRLVQEHIAALSSKLSENRIDYALFNTGRPLDHALFSYLSTRERLMRVR